MALTCSPVKKAFPEGGSKRPSSKAAGEAKPEADPPGYVKDFDEPRTKLADYFSILLSCEELFGVGRRKATKLSAVAGAIQDRNLQTLQ